MEENISREEARESYIPRPRWQVWLARAALVFVLLSVALWLMNIAHPV